jgi:hypothetical protein
MYYNTNTVSEKSGVKYHIMYYNTNTVKYHIMYYNTNTVSEKRKTTNKLKVENEH